VSGAFSIRHSLQGALQDFVRSAGFACVRTEELVRDLVCLLSSYREEDVPLHPVVYIVDAPEVLTTIAPGAERLLLGRTGYEADAAGTILKRCAGLAVRGWSVFVVKVAPDIAEYGVFRSLRHSFSTSAEESMKDLSDSSPVLLIRNRGHLVAEVRNMGHHSYTVSFTSAPASASPLAEDISRFVRSLTIDLNADDRSSLGPYLERVLTEALQRCHGTLLAAVTPPDDDSVLRTLEDGVWIRPPINLAERHASARVRQDANALADLQAAEALLEGMVSSDGVVVFGTNGTMLAYRVFLQPTEEEKRRLPERGGGRRRTFELMKSRVGSVLQAAFFRSQDGETDCVRVES
jgi:hypothetical protein